MLEDSHLQRSREKIPCAMLGKSGEKTINLQCEWGHCSYTASQMDDFCNHVGQHLPDQHLAERGDREVYDEFSCLWQGCGFSCIGHSADLIRHVFFHCYHTKLKGWGQSALESQNSSHRCLLDFQNRNLIPDVPEKHVCLWNCCQSSFDNIEWYYRHMEKHCELAEPETSAKESHMLVCRWKECLRSVKKRNKLREHLRSHTQEKVLSCPTCGGMFSNKTKFFDHIQRQTSEDQLCFQCSHCSKKFATERLLRDHMRLHVNYYKCPHCDMTCPLPSALNNHIRFRHSEERPHKCQFCDHRCKNLVDLRKHTDTHSKGPLYSCESENCDFSARTLPSIKAHYRKVHEGDLEPRYKCHLCEKCFSRGYYLTLHLRKNHQFKWPPGHPRFRYKEHEDGFLRLQLVRYESVEISEHLLANGDGQNSCLDIDSPSECLVVDEGDHNPEDLLEDINATSTSASLLMSPLSKRICSLEALLESHDVGDPEHPPPQIQVVQLKRKRPTPAVQSTCQGK